jgi:hypothetical protein
MHDKCVWQASFPNLRTLHFLLSSYFQHDHGIFAKYSRCINCGESAADIQTLAALLKETSIELRAMKVTALIKRIPMTNYYGEIDPVYCNCFKTFSELIVHMATKSEN